MGIRWSGDEVELLTATEMSGWGGKRHLVVEPMPEGGWDWAAWSCDGSGCLHGRAASAEAAMRAAEVGAAHLARRAIAVLAGLQVWDVKHPN